MGYLYLKSLHIIFIITWFSGLFYIVRLFIYHTEAQDKAETERKVLQTQYKLMSRRLWYIITWPSAILTAILGGSLLYQNPGYLTQDWMLVKLTFVVLLYGYHLLCHTIFVQLQRDNVKFTSLQLRIWNEVATILLFAIVFSVVLKSAVDWLWGVTGLVLLSAMIMAAVHFYKKIRKDS